jgi:hypothetical protein
MGSTRALFASIGVSVSLIAAAALSLFAVSVVIAFGGWSAGMGESEPATTLIVGSTQPAPAKHSGAHKAALAPVVLHAAARPRPRPSAPPRAHAVARTGSDAHGRVVSHAMVTSTVPKPVIEAPAAQPPAAVVQAPTTGDGVRRVGDDLSSTVQKTGEAVAAVIAPLSPPITSAVQKVIDLVATVLQRTTNGLGGTLDALTKKR